MANRKQVALLKQGVAASNAWNSGSILRKKADLSGRTSVERTYSGFRRQRPGRRPMRWRWRPLPDYLEAENIAGYAPSFTGTTFHSGSAFDRQGRLRRDCMSFGILIFAKEMSAISPQ
jgi:hypothetical protein